MTVVPAARFGWLLFGPVRLALIALAFKKSELEVQELASSWQSSWQSSWRTLSLCIIPTPFTSLFGHALPARQQTLRAPLPAQCGWSVQFRNMTRQVCRNPECRT